MNNRTNLYTKVAPYKDRESAWKDAADSTKKHVQYGSFLQSKGAKLIEGLDKIKTIDDAEKWQKLFDKSLANIEKGIKIERDARDKLIELYQQQPREKS